MFSKLTEGSGQHSMLSAPSISSRLGTTFSSLVTLLYCARRQGLLDQRRCGGSLSLKERLRDRVRQRIDPKTTAATTTRTTDFLSIPSTISSPSRQVFFLCLSVCVCRARCVCCVRPPREVWRFSAASSDHPRPNDGDDLVRGVQSASGDRRFGENPLSRQPARERLGFY